MFKTVRIAILLLILFFVSLGTWLDKVRSTDWDHPLRIAVYPIAHDDNPIVKSYIDALNDEDFRPIADFMQREGQRYNLSLAEPVRVKRFDTVESKPPELKPDSSILSRMFWSLRLRHWAWRVASGQKHVQPDVRIFVLYHDPQLQSAIPHSLGLQKGLIGVVHAFADRDMTGANNIVIAHEFLHTLGAIDKYRPGDNQPLFPIGFAEPERQPLYPQPKTEIMAGRRALSETESEMPSSLHSVVVGELTAKEIGWRR